MSNFAVDDLRRILIACAGESEADLSGDISDRQFDDLGYDSLALMETAARIEQDYGVRIPDEQIVELDTPRAVVNVVNAVLVEAS
ncbi:acyl carrier protein [Micromonospora sp. NPDC049230]|uniref:acyl carrier protein n=1 Tax=Micromonospora sp. NPDC049230 TaxID=3155502 RepID=UPI0033DC6B89